MKENKNKSYVLHIDSVESYINSVESFKNYKTPNVNLIKTESLTEKQMADIFTNNWISIKKRYNKKLWKMLKEIYAKQLKIDSIWIDSSIANLSFELFDKKQNLHTFKVHTEDSVLDFKVFKTKKEIGRGNVTPFSFVDSFTGPGSYSGRGIMRSSQYENIFNAAREFGNRYAEANGDCSELLNPEVGKKDSDNGCLKDRPGRVKYEEEDANKEPIVDVNYDKSETGDNGFSWNISVKVPDFITYENDWNIYQNVAGAGGFVVRNCYRHKSLISAVNFMRPISGSVNSVIIITEEVDTDMIGAVVYTKGMKLISPWVRVDSISDVIKLMTIPLHQHIVVAKKSVWKKLKNNVSEKEQSEMQSKTEEIEKIDDDECTFKFNVGGFTEKDCSLGELADKLDDSKVKWGDNISAEIKIAPNQLEMNLINKIAEILNSDCSVSSSLVAKDKVAMILHEVEHYKFQKDFDGDRINGLSINPRNPEISKANKIKVVVTKLHKDDDKRVNYTPECSIPLADKEIASKTAEEVSEYLDNIEYDAIINNIKISISKKYMTEKIAGKHNIILPKDFRERLCDLSYLPDLENRFKQFDNIGILQQELLLKSEDKDILEGIGELTFAQVLELFTVLADMKGMIKIKDEESGEYCLKHLEKKAELIVNDIKIADIVDIKISKMGVLLLTPENDSVGEFGRDSKNCTWELFANLEEAIDKLKKTNTEEKVYTLLKYQSRASTVFSNIVPRISKASFGNVFAVLLDADTLFYYRNKLKFNDEEIGLSCKPIKLKKEHNVRPRNKCWEHLAIEITEEDIKTKISIQPYIQKN